jgi:hypothetical protein
MKYETISSYLEPESEADGARLLAAGESFRLRADRLAGSWAHKAPVLRNFAAESWCPQQGSELQSRERIFQCHYPAIYEGHF